MWRFIENLSHVSQTYHQKNLFVCIVLHRFDVFQKVELIRLYLVS